LSHVSHLHQADDVSVFPAKFWCPTCGAAYLVEVRSTPTREKGSADCFACHQLMATWDGTATPSFRPAPMAATAPARGPDERAQASPRNA
jgi:hypothetical protein